MLRKFPSQLSGGMRQRIMIAIAISCNPKLLFADEPTTALDVTVQAQILELLTDLRQRLSMTMVLVTHDLGVVAETADRIAVMYNGKIVEEGARHGIPTPYNAALVALLKGVEHKATVSRGHTEEDYARLEAQAAGTLTPVQALYFNPQRAPEELYDTVSDPWEVRNLAADPAQAAKLAELRAECDRWVAHCGPVGEMSVAELVQKGIIQPRDEKYVERTKTGKVTEDETSPAKKAGKKANK